MGSGVAKQPCDVNAFMAVVVDAVGIIWGLGSADAAWRRHVAAIASWTSLDSIAYGDVDGFETTVKEWREDRSVSL